MSQIDDVIRRISNIDSAVEDALKNEVSSVVKDAIVQSARENVYDAYPNPKFYSRRNGAGGILDRESIDVEVRGTELTAKDNPDWQQLWGGGGLGVGSWRPAKRLAEAIAEGDRHYYMAEAGPRPFHEKAKEKMIADGSIDRALKKGLKRQGYDTSDITFNIV